MYLQLHSRFFWQIAQLLYPVNPLYTELVNWCPGQHSDTASMAYDLVETDQTGCSLSITPAFEGDMLTSVISLLTGQVTPNWCHPCIWRQYTQITELVLTKLSSPRTNAQANACICVNTPNWRHLEHHIVWCQFGHIALKILKAIC